MIVSNKNKNMFIFSLKLVDSFVDTDSACTYRINLIDLSICIHIFTTFGLLLLHFPRTLLYFSLHFPNEYILEEIIEIKFFDFHTRLMP